MYMHVVCVCFVSFTAVDAQQSLRMTVAADTVTLVELPDVMVVSQWRVSAVRQVMPLQVMDGESIHRLGIQDLSEAVRCFSGVTVKDYGGIGGLKTVSIRSLGAHHTAVSYDGVSVADAQSGQVDISRFTLDNAEMVSLSFGLSDDIFQTARIHASAGALNIRTQKPQFEADKSYLLSVRLKGGSFGLFNPIVSYSQKLGTAWSASIHADYMGADGNYPFTLVNGAIRTREKRLNSDIETVRAEGNIYGDFGAKGGSLETKLYAFRSERGLPGAVRLYAIAANECLWNDNSFIQSRYKNQINQKFAIQAVAKYSYSYSRYKITDDKYAAGYQEDRNTQNEFYASAGVLYALSGSLSASLTTDYAHTRLVNNFLHSTQPRRNASWTAFSLQYVRDAFTATGNLLGAYLTDEAAGGGGNRPANHKRLSPAAAISWRPFEKSALRVRASYKDVYRVPTFADLYYLRAGNAGLKPEKATQFNAGLTWVGAFGKVIRYASISADGYYNRVDDKIVALPTLYIWRMMNMGTVDIKGTDINVVAEASLHEKVSLTFSGSYTFQRSIDVTSPDAKNYKDQIPYTPRHTGTGSFAFEMPWLNVSYLLTAVGKRYALPQNTAVNRIDRYTEQSVSLNRTFNLKPFSLRLQGEIINLADTQYDVIQYYPMPGRSWRLTATINL
jgi:outer membrane cobalamin receptor